MKGVRDKKAKPSRRSGSDGVRAGRRSDAVSEPILETMTGNQLTDDQLQLQYGASSKVIQWSFTICVQPWRKFSDKKYEIYTAIDQRDILNAGIVRSLYCLDLDPHYTYEMTEKFNVHVHGTFFSDGINALLFQSRCVSEFGYKNTKPQRLCCLKPSFNNESSDSYTNWSEYMLKSTPEGKFGGLTVSQINTNMFI